MVKASEVGHILDLISLMFSLTKFQMETKTTLQMLKADKLECLSMKRLSMLVCHSKMKITNKKGFISLRPVSNVINLFCP